MRVFFALLFLALISCRKQISPTFLQKKLVGTWHGTGEHFYGTPATWEATFKIEDNGYYSAAVTAVSSGTVPGVFDIAGDDYYSIDRTFAIHTINDLGKASGVVKQAVTVNETFPIKFMDLEFSDDYKTVKFTAHEVYPIYYVLLRE